MANKYKAPDLIKTFQEYRAYKLPLLQDWRLIRALYTGDFWTVFKNHIKDYTLNPDWNYFEYVVQAYQNSVYSGAFIGTLTPVNVEDTEYIDNLNAFISYNWNKWGMKNEFLHVGMNGELYDLGVVRVDWDDSEGGIVIKQLSSDEVYLDPSVTKYQEGHAVFIERSVNIDTLADNPNFQDGIKSYTNEHKSINDKTINSRITMNGSLGGQWITGADKPLSYAVYGQQQTSNNRQVSLIEAFIRNEKGKIDQVFILDETTIIYERTDIDLKLFPVICYTPQAPDSGPYGQSKLKKIINTVVTLNILDSFEATQPFRLLNRVKLINVDGRLNLRSFAEFGNTPGATFECKGDPSGLIRYVDVPTIPDMSNLKNRLENSIFQVTGVDPYYKGRMTNSIQTTGGTQAFQARVTMLTDNSRLTMLEQFCENITKCIIEFYMNFSKDKIYNVPILSATGTNKVVRTDKVTFDPLKKPDFNYMINASILLPMNQANLFESAKILYEMQGQYQFKIKVISEEDLVRYSDFPQKDLILQRIEQQKQGNTSEDLIADITNFASIFTRLLSQGLSQEEAAQQALAILTEEKNAMMQDPSLGRGFE